MDAKWKITDFSREDAGIERDDFYQAIAYGLAYRAPVVLVFPGLREDLATAEFVVEHGDAGIEITAVQVPVTTPCRTSRELRQQTAEHLYSVLQRHSSGLSSSVLIGGVHEQLD